MKSRVGKRTLALILAFNIALLATGYVCAWYGLLPIDADAQVQRTIAIVLAVAAVAETVAALIVVSRHESN